MLRILIAVVIFIVILRVGLIFLRGFARPIEVPEPGDLRRVDLRYRCVVCGAEMRMTRAANDDPLPPRHCMEEMDLVARGDV